MKTKARRFSHTILITALAFLATCATVGACTAEFKTRCPDGTVQNGGGDVDDLRVCQPIAGAGGAAGEGGQAGSASGTAGAGGLQGAAGSGGAMGGGRAGGEGVPFAKNVLAARHDYNCAYAPGSLLCWGYNFYGQLGSSVNNGAPNAPNPVPILVASNDLGAVQQVALGDYHSCALREDGRVLCWGYNHSGQLGNSVNNGTASAANPVPALINSSELAGVRQLALGNEHSCAIRDDGRVLCWGLNRDGQLGVSANIGSDVANPVPALVAGGALVGVRLLALGGSHSCALRNDGRVLCWGRNNHGQIGTSVNVGTGSPISTPLLVDNNEVVDVRQIEAGFNHTCALRNDGHVLCWGDNRSGQLGNETNFGEEEEANPVPALVDSGALGGGVRQIAASNGHSCVLRDDGRVLCWGSNIVGQLGHSGPDTPVPTLIDNDALVGAHQLVLGRGHSCILRDDGKVFCWGNNLYGQISGTVNNGVNSSNPPILVQPLPLLTAGD